MEVVKRNKNRGEKRADEKGFLDKATKVKSMLIKESKSGMSSICYMVKKEVGSTGGLVGDPAEVMECLYNAAKKNSVIYEIMKTAVKVIDEERASEGDKIVLMDDSKLSDLFDGGFIGRGLFNVLDDNSFETIGECKEDFKRLLRLRGMGVKKLEELKGLVSSIGSEITNGK